MVADCIRVLIADDHTIVRAGVRLLLGAEADIEVVGEASNGKEALALAASLRPDVILMDISMPDMHGLEATRQIKARFPDVHVLVLTMHDSDEYFFAMLKAGASGYVLKGAEIHELIHALRTVSQDQVYLQPTMAKRLLHDYLQRVDETESFGLTPREKDILRLLVEGYSTKEIAEQLFISPSTIHSHRTNLMRKLKVGSRHELIQYARQHGLQ